MRRRTMALALAGLTLMAAVAGAVVLLGPPRVPLSDDPSDADRVTLYQNGLAFVELTRAFESRGGESLLTLSLPTTARFDSITVEGEGVEVRQLRSRLSEAGSLQPGDEVVVRVKEGEAYEGTYLATRDGRAVLATASGTVLVDLSHVTAIELVGRTLPQEADAGAAEASVLVSAPAGTHEVRVTYLAEGPGWTPSYHLDAQTGHMVFYATLTGLADWRNVTLDLVAGSPHVVLRPRAQPVPMPFEAAAADRSLGASAAQEDRVGPSVPLGELHRYRYEAPLSISRGERLRIAVEEGDVEITRHYLEVRASVHGGYIGQSSQPLTVQERYEIRNTLGEPLPPGVVEAYRDGTWIGQDLLQATPRGAVTNLTLATSENVEARLVAEDHTSTGALDTTTYAVHVENFKDEPADVRLVVTHPTHRTRLVSTDPPPDETLGGQLVWNVQLDPGEKRSFRLTIETSRG